MSIARSFKIIFSKYQKLIFINQTKIENKNFLLKQLVLLIINYYYLFIKKKILKNN